MHEDALPERRVRRTHLPGLQGNNRLAHGRSDPTVATAGPEAARAPIEPNPAEVPWRA
jgi:hypothetical protein